MHSNLTRRTFIKTVSAGALAAGLGGCSQSGDRGLHFASLHEALAELNRLTQAASLSSLTEWSWPETLMHCTQSIEFSLSGFPQEKSALFQQTLGAAAFNIFSLAGRMQHNLAEPIPGAPALDAGLTAGAAEHQLRQAIARFETHQGPLQPHFAYGRLNKADYERAHAMHLADHFSAFVTNIDPNS